MQAFEQSRSILKSGKVVTDFQVNKLSIKLSSTYENGVGLDDLLYTIACQKLCKNVNQKRDNLVFMGRDGKI